MKIVLDQIAARLKRRFLEDIDEEIHRDQLQLNDIESNIV